MIDYQSVFQNIQFIPLSDFPDGHFPQKMFYILILSLDILSFFIHSEFVDLQYLLVKMLGFFQKKG